MPASFSSHRAPADFPAMFWKENQRMDAHRPRRFRVGLVVGLLAAMLAFPALVSAQGQSPTADQYGGSETNVDQQVGGGGSGDDPGLGGNVGPLPFTGFDVIAMAGIALAVTGIGLALQRAVRRESTEEL
jgi:hypothetical protein